MRAVLIAGVLAEGQYESLLGAVEEVVAGGDKKTGAVSPRWRPFFKLLARPMKYTLAGGKKDTICEKVFTPHPGRFA